MGAWGTALFSDDTECDVPELAVQPRPHLPGLVGTKVTKSILVTIFGLAIILTAIKLWSSPSYYAQVWAEQVHKRFGPKTPERAKTAARCVLAGAMVCGAVMVYGGLWRLAHLAPPSRSTGPRQ